MVSESTMQARDKASYENSSEFAAQADAQDTLRRFRNRFSIPKTENGAEIVYLSGNSLGLMPHSARKFIDCELDDWANLAVEGHWAARTPWWPYHETLTGSTARLVGAKPSEVVVMNTLTTNLHLMMVSFYNPSPTRYKILIEGGAFPSDRYAVASQARFHGFPREAVIEVNPRPGEANICNEDIEAAIVEHGQSLALVLLGQVNYLTGQAFDVPSLRKAAHSVGARFGLNLAHGAGNLLLSLHDWQVDFAVWCSYKYLNAGPGGLSGCFVHERHGSNFDLPRFCGWWGHDKDTRIKMGPDFNPIAGAEGWQLSNPPIFQLAALRASMEIFDEATMPAIRAKSERLTGYLAYLLESIPDNFATVVTPANPAERGCQLSVRVKSAPKRLKEYLKVHGAICDFREPDILRAAPAPLYNSFSDVYKFAELVRQYAKETV